MQIVFRHSRLLVGYRQKDWQEVWYAPELQNAPDGVDNPIILLYNSSGGYEQQDPMEEEVIWFPNFDVARCEANTKRVKQQLQMQTLYRAWNYLNENDQDRIRDLDDKYEDPKFRRWQSWFDHAKAFKKKKLKERVSRRAKRTSDVQKKGQPPGSVEITSDTSEEDDSAYESEEEIRMPVRKDTSMGPPPVRGRKSNKFGPSKQGIKRKHTQPDHPNGQGREVRPYRDSVINERARSSPLLEPEATGRSLFLSLNRSRSPDGEVRSPDPLPPHSVGGRNFPDDVIELDSDEEKPDGQPTSQTGDEADNRARQMNGDISEADAVEQAMRASVKPETQTQGTYPYQPQPETQSTYPYQPQPETQSTYPSQPFTPPPSGMEPTVTDDPEDDE